MEGERGKRSRIEVPCCFPQSFSVLFRNWREALANQVDAGCAAGFPQISLLIPSPFVDRRCLCGFHERENFQRELFPARFPQAGMFLGIAFFWRTAGIAHDKLGCQQNRSSDAGAALHMVDKHSGRDHPDFTCGLTHHCKPRTQQR